MEYRKGTIARKRGTIFKDNGKIDPRKYGHPVFIPIASDDINMNTYYLILDSHPEKYLRREGYYTIEDWEETHLDCPSVINLKDIYKGHIFEQKFGGLSPRVYRDVLREFVDYQEKHPDEFFEELKAKL